MSVFILPCTAKRCGALLVLLGAVSTSGCIASPAGMIVSSVAQAAFRTAIEQAEKNRPTPEQMWHEAQVASLERRALAGELQAQFEIGTYYVLLQEPAAQQWICVAANRGHAKAQLQYGHWFNEDRNREDLFPFIAIAPDDSTAFLWYSLASSNGEPRAPHFRDNLVHNGIAQDKLAAGRARLASWTPDNCGLATTLTTASLPAVTTER